jgi:hypothetical protein
VQRLVIMFWLVSHSDSVDWGFGLGLLCISFLYSYCEPLDHSTMAWATYMFLAASTAFLSFSLFVRIDASRKNDDDDGGNSNNHHQNSVSVGVSQKQHGEGHPKSSKSSWKDSADVGAVSVMTTNSFKYYFLLQLAWTALAMWSISFAIHGILLKYFYHYSVMVNLSTIIETIFQFSGILILGVFIHSTSWTLVVVLASPQKQPTPTC